MRTATAGWPLQVLVNALARGGWSALDERRASGYRAIMHALSILMPASGQADITVPQIADVAGLSERWTRDRLKWLEEAGLIKWTRGGIVQGKPSPSTIRVSKAALADLVNRARREIPNRLAERARTTSKRIRDTLRQATVFHRSKRSRPSRATQPHVSGLAHAEASAGLLSLKGGGLDPSRVSSPSTPCKTIIGKPKPVAGSRVQALRAAKAAAQWP